MTAVSDESIKFFNEAMKRGLFQVQMNEQLLKTFVAEEVRSILGREENLEMSFYRYLAIGMGITATILLAGGLVLVLWTGALFGAIVHGNEYSMQSLVTYGSSIIVAVVLYCLTWLFVRRYQESSAKQPP